MTDRASGARDWLRRFVLLGLGLALLVPLAPLRAYAEPPTAPDGPVVPAIPQRYLDQPVEWSTCVFDSTIRRLAPGAQPTSCATVRVPMDWLHPRAHHDIDLAIAYTPASGVSRGLLTADPGGPTTANRSFPAALGVEDPRLFTDYDLLGVDPRGYGASERLRCPTTDGRLARLNGYDPTDRSPRGQAAREGAARLVAQACGSSELAGFVSSRQMAYDLAFVRVLLGYDRLSMLGYGTGARLAATYAALYPDAIDRLVLDSVPADLSPALARFHDPEEDRGPDVEHGDGPVPGGVSEDLARAAQQRLDELYGWLARHDPERWGGTAAEVAQRHAQVREELAGHRLLRGWQLDLALRSTLADDDTLDAAAALLAAAASLADVGEADLAPDEADLLARARLDLLATSAGGLAWAIRFARTQPRDEKVALGASPDVVRCNDLRAAGEERTRDATRRAVDDAWEASEAMVERAPFLGALAGPDVCTYWEPAVADRSVAPDLTDLTGGLVVQSGLDPFGDFGAALRLHAASPATVLVTVPASGRHGLSLSGRSACVDAVVASYLFGPTATESAPLVDTVCAARPLPGDEAAPALGPEAPGEPAESGTPPVGPVNPVLAALWAEAAAHS